MKKVRSTVFLFMALFFSSGAFGIDVLGSTAFGIIAQGSSAARLLEVRATDSGEVFSYTVANGVGGVLFQATAVPIGNAVNQPISVKYDPAKDDGQRLLVTVGTGEIAPPLYDWQLIPTARYADSEYNACITLLGRPTYLEMLTGGSGDMYLEVHPSFSNTLIGFNLFLIDAMLINPDRIRRIPGAFSETVQGYNDGEFNETRSASSVWQLNQMLSRWQYGYTSYIYTDCETDINYDVIDGQLVFMGVPTYRFLLLDHTNNSCYARAPLSPMLKADSNSIAFISEAMYICAFTAK
jgi:hypothetical protein